MKRYMNIAKEVSKLSTFRRVHIGVVVVYRKQIIGVGYNSYKTHPLSAEYAHYRYDTTRQYLHHGSLHAEMSALIPVAKMDIDFSKVRVYVYRAGRDGKERMSRPCKSCMAYIKSLGIRRVIYTTNDGYCDEELEY